MLNIVFVRAGLPRFVFYGKGRGGGEGGVAEENASDAVDPSYSYSRLERS